MTYLEGAKVARDANATSGRRRRRFAPVTALVALISLGGTGCSADPPAGPKEISAQELGTRPHIYDIMADYDEVLAEARAALEVEFPEGMWRQDSERTITSGYLADGTTPTKRGWSARWVFDLSTSQDEESKARAIRAVDEVVTRHGFHEMVIYVDRDGQIEAVTQDSYGGTITFGSVKATVLSASTAYHPPGPD